MSLVENICQRRIFAAFFACAMLAGTDRCLAQHWQQAVSQQLLEQWQAISGRQDNVEISYPGLQDNYQLQECPGGINIDLVKPLQAGRNGLEISCSQPYWKQHLAVQLHNYQKVAVLSRAARADTRLLNSHIRYIKQDTGELSKGFFTRKDILEGKQLRRTLRAGTILSPDMVEEPLVIQRGERVNIQVDRPGIHIAMKGIALESARPGERLRVRNEQSQRIISAIAVKSGLVQVQ